MSKSESRIKKTWVFAIAALCIILIAIAGFFSYRYGYSKAKDLDTAAVESIKAVREDNTSYKFIYPLLLYTFGKARQFLEMTPLDAQLNSYIQSEYQNKEAQSISVTVRDFTNNRWAGVNESTTYHPGSMMKVILMIGYYKEAQANPSLLQQTLTYSSQTQREVNSVPLAMQTDLMVGKSYTISNLLQQMIAQSDNGAEQLLLDNANTTILNQAYIDLGVPVDNSGDYTISSAQYTNFLKILYNATYLKESSSEQALSMMSQSTFTQGIVAGVPSGTEVAQKYGEHIDTSGNVIESVELGDCGIVYAPKDTYAICVMTKKAATDTTSNTDADELASIIKNLSGIVYNYETSH